MAAAEPDIWTKGSAIGTVVGGIGAIAAIVVAGWQIRRARIDANRRASMDQLHVVAEHVAGLHGRDLGAARDNIVARYREEDASWGETEERYWAFLVMMDMLALAVEKNVQDRRLTTEYLRAVCGRDIVTLDYLKEFQACCGEPKALEHLERLLKRLNSKVVWYKPWTWRQRAQLETPVIPARSVAPVPADTSPPARSAPAHTAIAAPAGASRRPEGDAAAGPAHQAAAGLGHVRLEAVREVEREEGQHRQELGSQNQLEEGRGT